MKEKAIASALLLFILFSFISSIIEGSGGLATTRLTANIDSTAVTIPVSNTVGFPVAGADQTLRVIYIEDERIEYTAFNAANTTFTAVTRGTGDTVATTHLTGTKVYSADTNVINTALGFNISESQTTLGGVALPQIIGKFFFVSLPRLITWDFNWLKVGAWQYVRYILFALSAAFVISLTLVLMSAFGGVLQAIFKVKGV